MMVLKPSTLYPEPDAVNAPHALSAFPLRDEGY